VFGAVLIGAGARRDQRAHPVYSALAVMCFITSAAIWLLIEAEFSRRSAGAVYVARSWCCSCGGHDCSTSTWRSCARDSPASLARLAHGPGR